MDGSKGTRSLSRVRRSRLAGLLGLIFLLIGGLLLVAGGLWSRHQNTWARSYLDELQEKVALIPVFEGESASLLSPLAAEAIEQRTPSAETEAPAPMTQPEANQKAANLTHLPVSLRSSGGLSLFSSESTTPPSSIASNPGTEATLVTQPEANQKIASLTPAVPSVTTITGAGTSLESETATGLPSHSPAASVQSASVITVESGQKVFAFTPVHTGTLPPIGSLHPAIGIRIPAIGLVSPVVPLNLLNHRGYWLFSLPKENVGWIATTGNPGEGSRGWYMGHQSQVFERLPEIVDLITGGKTVDVILETEKVAYLYRVTGRPVILTASEFNSGYFHANLFAAESEIVLTTCVPPKKWDYRLLVRARLVGDSVRPVAE